MTRKRRLRGGWEKTDEDFVTYKRDVIDKYNELGIFEKAMTLQLIEWVNKTYNTNFPVTDDIHGHVVAEIIRFFRKTVMVEQPESLRDDFNYDMIKFSIIPMGTRFYRRMDTPTYTPVRKATWFDYTGTMSETKFSFLKDINKTFTAEYSDKIIEHFGQYLYEFEVTKDLLILHFPSEITPYFESWVRRMCIDTRYNVCVDGYTLNFLKFNTQSKLKHLPSLDGIRELCILDKENIRVVSMVRSPFGIPLPPTTLSLQNPLPMKRVASFTRKTPPPIREASSTPRRSSSSSKLTPPSSRRSSSSSKLTPPSSRRSSSSSRRSSSSGTRSSSTRRSSSSNKRSSSSIERRKYCEELYSI